MIAAYLAKRILKGYLKYEIVIAKFPEFKEGIDFILMAEGRGDLIK